jgi:hypothetical protein
MWALAKLKYKLSPDRQKDILEYVTATLPQFDHHSLALMSYSLGLSETQPGAAWLSKLVDEMLSRTVNHNRSGLIAFTPQGLCMALWGLGRMGYQPDERFTAHVNAVLAKPARLAKLQVGAVGTQVLLTGLKREWLAAWRLQAQALVI